MYEETIAKIRDLPAPLRLFLSYGRRDAAPLANRLREDLEKRGYEVWQDTRQIRAGKDWEQEIRDGLRSTQVVIALLSPHAVRRESDPASHDNLDSVCLDELTFARFATPPTPIVPVMAIACEPPFSVFRLDYVAMTRWLQSEDEYRYGFERLLTGIEAAARGEPLPFRRWYHCLPVLDFAAELHEKRQDFVGRQWLFTEIETWRVASNRERALLVVGDPGIGKSAFVAEMIYRNPGGQVLAYHVCRADDPETLRPSTFVMSLAGMIAGRIPAFADLLDTPQYQKLFDPNTVPGRCQHVFEQGLLAALHQLPAPSDGIRYLLIDALDEALTLEEGQVNLITLLAPRLERLPPWLRIVATTRREPDVMNRLSGLRATAIDAHRQDNLDDIDQFIAARLESSNLAERLTVSRLESETVQKKLSAKADGNFLYVSQALKDIERDNYSFSHLDKLPQGLNQWYETWFSRKFPNPKIDFVDVRRLLEVILAAREPLSRQLAAISAEVESQYALPALLSLLGPYISETDRGIFVYHKSLIDWLLSSTGPYRVSIREGHRKLANYCLRELERIRSDVAHSTVLHYPYVRHVLDHLGEIEEWADYVRLMDDEALFEIMYPVQYEYSNSWELFSSPEPTLPVSARRMPIEWRVNLCMAHANRFALAAKRLYDDFSLSELPDYGRRSNKLRDHEPRAFGAFRDACYTFVFRSSLAIAYAELAVRIDTQSSTQRVREFLQTNSLLVGTLQAFDTPNGTGLSAKLEDQTSFVIERWDTLRSRISQ